MLASSVHLVAFAVVMATLFAPFSDAHSADADHAAALYTTQIQFDRNNIPVVSIGLVSGKDAIRFVSSGRLRVLPNGEGGPEVILNPQGTWTATVIEGAPARLSWRVRLAAHAANDLSRVQAARKLWKERGVAARPVELGSVFGFFGKVLDTRAIVLASKKTFTNRAHAEAEATRLAAKHEVETNVMPVVEARATGKVVLTDGTSTVQADSALFFAPVDPNTTLQIESVEFGKGFAWHGHEDRNYRGTLYLAVGPSGKLDVGNLVPAETLLRGLVPAEIYPTAPVEALKAQAVSARGELLAKIGTRHLADPFLVCADVHCQVYAGTKRESEATDAAVKATAGQMLFSGERLVDTVYSANCGGHTEHSENVWNTKPTKTLRGKPDGKSAPKGDSHVHLHEWITNPPKSFCNHPRYGKTSFRWEKEVSAKTIRTGLRKRQMDPGRIRTIEVLARGVSGRAKQVAIAGTDRRVVLNGELAIRQTFGGLRSSMFIHEAVGPAGVPTAFKFTGGGFGHGVGMCQIGAIGRAEAGQSFQTILQHYYTGGTVERIY
ncbi:MAG: stage II sporulation protein D [Myxococcota bacterium]|jgi:stage II sporulation protein D